MMIADNRYDELERRLRTAESDIIGDRHVSQYAAEQARRGTEALLALRSEVAALRADIAGTTARVDALGENMAAANAMLVRHGRALEMLQQDVREMRQEAASRHAELLAAIGALGSGGTSPA
jgi:hypothetical protein